MDVGPRISFVRVNHERRSYFFVFGFGGAVSFAMTVVGGIFEIRYGLA